MPPTARAALCVLSLACASKASPPPAGDGGGAGTAGGDGGAAAGTLRIEPQDPEVSVTGGKPAVVEFAAILTGADGEDRDATEEAGFSIDDRVLGTFDGARFTSAADRAGRTRVRARARGLSAETGLTVRLATHVIGPGAPADAPGRFAGRDGGPAPELVYPADGVLVPPNLHELEFQFRPGAGHTLFELRLAGSTLDLRVYLGCAAAGGGCVYAPDAETWDLIARAERGREPARWQVRGVDADGTVGESAGREIAFAEEDLLGGIYYWNAGGGAIERYDFGLRGQATERYLDRARAGAMTCVGCHALSRDGSRIAVGMDIPAPSPYAVFDVATREALYRQGALFGGGGANFFSFSPDASQIMTSNGISIVWRDAATGQAITNPLVDLGTMPDWSPDGSALVYARPATRPPCPIPSACGVPAVAGASLEVRRMGAAGWGAADTLVASGGANHYYPAFSPDGNWVLYNRSPSNQASMDAPDAELWVVPAGGGDPIRLARADDGETCPHPKSGAPGPCGDSWPKWAPHLQQHLGSALLWFTFSSRRSYGLRLSTGERAQIWMAGFAPGRESLGADPSLPAFRLPFQAIDSGNHIAQWVAEVHRRPCSDGDECPSGEFCEGGVCFPLLE